MKSPLRFATILAVVAGLFLSSSPAFAQGSVSAQFKVIPLTGNFSGLGFKSGGAPTAITPGDTKTYSYNGPAAMEIDRGNNPVGKIYFPGTGSFTVYLLGADDGTISGGAVASDKTAFPLGSYRILNITSFNMLVELAGKRAKLNAGSSLMTTVPPVKPDAVNLMKFLLASNPDAELYHMAVEPDKTGRTTAVVMCTNETQVKQKKGEPNFNVMIIRDDAASPKSASPGSSSSTSKASSTTGSGNNRNNSGGKNQRRGN